MHSVDLYRVQRLAAIGQNGMHHIPKCNSSLRLSHGELLVCA